VSVRAIVLGVMLIAIAVPRVASADTERVTIGSKAFPESWILGEAMTMLAASSGADARHAQNLGGTEITYGALAAGEIDVYPEYTGTIAEVLLHGAAPTPEALRAALAARGLAMSAPLGFNDGYAIAVRRDVAQRHALRALSDLARTPELRFGLTHEFIGRPDGFPGLCARYAIAPRDVRGVEHELALAAIARGELDVVDVYTTDAQIDAIGVVLLDDDRAFFPRYDAVLLHRADLAARAPRAFEAMTRLAGHVDEAAMRRANVRVVVEHARVSDAARAMLSATVGDVIPRDPPRDDVASTIARETARHLELVAASLLASIVLGIPLGVVASRSRALAAIVITSAGLLQTIPSLALLALLIPLLGIGAKPALAALFLYGLLPIVRSTHAGLTTIPPSITDAAEAIGLPSRARLARVYLPIASPHILAGVRTSAVIGVGTATIAALIGARGLGDPILQGIALHDTSRVLEGAVPAALLALIIDGAFAIVARALVPRGLHTRS
jgi:osmoprotectant transport system permease protein